MLEEVDEVEEVQEIEEVKKETGQDDVGAGRDTDNNEGSEGRVEGLLARLLVGRSVAPRTDDPGEEFYEKVPVTVKSLSEHLSEQLLLTGMDEEGLSIGTT